MCRPDLEYGLPISGTTQYSIAPNQWCETWPEAASWEADARLPPRCRMAGSRIRSVKSAMPRTNAEMTPKFRFGMNDENANNEKLLTRIIDVNTNARPE